MAVNTSLTVNASDALPNLLGRSRCGSSQSSVAASSRKNTWDDFECDYEQGPLQSWLEPEPESDSDDQSTRASHTRSTGRHSTNVSESSSDGSVEHTSKLCHSRDGSLTSTHSPAAAMGEKGGCSNLGVACSDAPKTTPSPTVCIWVQVPMMNMALAQPYLQPTQFPVGFYQNCWDQISPPPPGQYVAVGSPFGLNTPTGTLNSTPHMSNVVSADPCAMPLEQRTMLSAPPGTWNSTSSVVNLPADPCAMVNDQKTTLMLRNIPNNYEPTRLMALLDAEGFAAQYDFVYLPRDFKSRVALGYGFVNFTTVAHALRAFRVFTEFTNWGSSSKKACQVQWSRTQGFAANVEAVRTSPAMRKSVVETFKPVILQNGVRIKFPSALSACNKKEA